MEHMHCLSDKIRSIRVGLGKIGDRHILIGGTALTLRIRHRTSVDIGLTTSLPVEHPRRLRRRIDDPRVGKHKVARTRPDHHVKFFETDDTPKIDVHGKDRRPALAPPNLASNGLRVASLTDIMAQKMQAMHGRFEARDGEDMAVLPEHGGADVPLAVAAFRGFDRCPGVGRDGAETLAARLSDPNGTPWRGFPVLKQLVDPLVSEMSFVPPLHHDRIEGGGEIGPLAVVAKTDERIPGSGFP